MTDLFTPRMTECYQNEGRRILSSEAISSLEQWMERESVGVAIQGDGVYIHRMCKIKPAPYLYYYKGNHDLLHKPPLALVGPRKMKTYASHVLAMLISELRHYDVATISGMTEGVDQLAHTLSLENNISMIAVLGAGIGYVAKSRRRSVMDSIIDAGGLVLSEFPLGSKATHYSYPQRNRLVAGLSYGDFLPEAREGSDSLITVDFTHTMGIPIGDAPQSVDLDSSRGLHLEMRAGRVRQVIDIAGWLQELFWQISM